jgi:hypothetical protein
MARIRSINRYSGKLGGVTVVDSKTYGQHTRSNRGTFKPSPVNASFERSQDLMREAVHYAQPIFNILKPYRSLVTDGKLWTRLKVHIMDQLKKTNAPNINTLRHLTLAKNQSLTSALSLAYTKTLDAENSRLTIAISNQTMPVFHHRIKFDSYQLSFIAIFLDGQNMATNHSPFVLKNRGVKDASPFEIASFDIPVAAKTILLVGKCSAIWQGHISCNMKANGFGVVEVIELNKE